MVRWFLFETRLGCLVLAGIERAFGLGVVVVEQMEAERYAPVEKVRG